MKLLVTGGCGFIGSNFILRAQEKLDCEILNIDKLTYAGNLNNLALVKASSMPSPLNVYTEEVKSEGSDSLMEKSENGCF